MKLLISFGEDIDQLFGDEGTLLHIAAEKGHSSIVSLLLNKNAKLDIENNNGQKPLDVAISNGHQKVAELITETAIERNEKPEE